MAVTKDLGAVTAYAHAVEGGYTGTLAEFETLMASYATVAQQAAASASDAEAFGAGTRSGVPVSSGDDAYENNAVYYAGLAEDAKDDAEAAAASLVIEDEFDEDSTNALENGVITKALETKAEIDGAYESMTVGNAEQLVSTVFVNDEEPYNFRTSGGSADIGDRLYDTIVGGTVAWNQLVAIGKVHSTHTKNDITGTNNGDGSITLTGTASELTYLELTGSLNTMIENHIYFLGESSNFKFSDGYATDGRNIIKWNRSTIYGTVYALINSGVTLNEKVYPQVIDLTQMFGSTIADYIYSLEQATTGAGVAWFRKLFPKPYYAYNAGELMSVNTSAHNTVGFNAWDEVTELGYINNSTGENVASTTQIRGKNYIPVIPNTTYYFKSPTGLFVYFYDSNKGYIGVHGSGTRITNNTITLGADVHYIRVSMPSDYGTTYNNDICINLSWDGERDGEYEEYVKHSYPLDSDLTLRGIPKLDASNNLYYDGDVYESDGSVTRKWGVYTFDGTETWTQQSEFAYTWAGLTSLIKGLPNDNTLSSMRILGLTISTRNAIAYGVTIGDVIGESSGGGIYITTDVYNNLATKINGKTLLYELATPTMESADPFQSPQIVDDFGTEEYVDYAVSEGDRDVAIPVGHITKYTNNLRAKLEMSPNSPDGAGDYLVRQTNGNNEYVSLASNATIQDIIARLEALEGQGGE